MLDKEYVKQLRELRDAADDKNIDEIVRWQMTGLLLRKSPVFRRPVIPRCSNCGADWHGLPRGRCGGSHLYDTPVT